MSVEMSQSLVQELEILKEVYCDELEIRPNQNFLKLKVKCMPLLEDKNVEHHYEFDNPYLFATIDVPNDYPTQRPKIHLETTHSKIAIGSHIADLTNRVEELLKAYSGDPCIVDTIEFIRVGAAHSGLAVRGYREEKQALQEEEAPAQRPAGVPLR